MKAQKNLKEAMRALGVAPKGESLSFEALMEIVKEKLDKKNLPKDFPPIDADEISRYQEHGFTGQQGLRNYREDYKGVFGSLNTLGYVNVLNFLQQIESKGVIEVGPGRGVIGRALEECGIDWEGHELRGPYEGFSAGQSNFVNDQKYTFHTNSSDFSYLKDAAVQGKTLLLCWPPIEPYEDSKEDFMTEGHGSFMAYNTSHKFLEECLKAKTPCNIIYIGAFGQGPLLTAGEKFTKFISDEFRTTWIDCALNHLGLWDQQLLFARWVP